MKILKNPKRLTLGLLLGLFLVALPAVALAAKDDSIFIGPDEIIDGNFIKFANVIDIQAPVNGDVIVVASSLTISGPVAGDVIAVANIIRISGEVSGSIRVAGGSIEIDSQVSQNVWAVGSTVAINPEAKVSWDVYAAGANVDIEAPVGGNIWAAGAAVVINNEVGKNVAVSIDKDGQLIFNPQAKVKGDVTYKAKSEDQLIIREGAEISGQISKKAIALPSDFDLKRFFNIGSIFFTIITLFSLLVIGLIFVSLVPKVILDIKTEMIKRPAASIGRGLVYFIVTPVITILLMITVIGIPLALIIISLYLISLFVSKVIAAFVIGLVLVDKISKDKYKGSLVWPLVIGLLVYIIITRLPLVGWLITLTLMLWVLGALIKIKKDIWQEYR